MGMGWQWGQFHGMGWGWGCKFISVSIFTGWTIAEKWDAATYNYVKSVVQLITEKTFAVLPYNVLLLAKYTVKNSKQV